MNPRQRNILGVGLVVAAAMCVLVPWQATTTWRSAETGSVIYVQTQSVGYAPVFLPPTGDGMRGSVGSWVGSVTLRVNVVQLLIQALALAAVCGALVLASGSHGKEGGA